MMDLQRATEIAMDITQEAAALALGYYGQAQVHHKGDGSLVTEADREAEKLIRRRLDVEFPGHAACGEEFGLVGEATNPHIWYIDPVDGTSNFVFGLPIWGVSLGLTYEGRPVVGAFVMPAAGEKYWAWLGGGAYLNGERLYASDTAEMRHNDLLSISSTTADLYELDFPQKMRCLGSAAHALASVAAGHFVAAIHDDWYPHDMAAALCMCLEADAVVTDDAGRPFETYEGLDWRAKSPTLIAAGPNVHARILETVRRK